MRSCVVTYPSDGSLTTLLVAIKITSFTSYLVAEVVVSWVLRKTK